MAPGLSAGVALGAVRAAVGEMQPELPYTSDFKVDLRADQASGKHKSSTHRLAALCFIMWNTLFCFPAVVWRDCF